MRENSHERAVSLERVRLEEGEERCAAVLDEAARRSRQRAAGLLNAPEVGFPCLFVLLPRIRAQRLEGQLDPVRSAAAEIVGGAGSGRRRQAPARKGGNRRAALRWMLETGADDAREDGAYQQAIDVAVSVLIHTYGDREILPAVAELIFARRRRGQNVHDLVWAFFRSRDPEALRLFARRLPGADEGEAAFIRDILGMDEAVWDRDPHGAAQRYLALLDTQEEHLRFTEESKQYTSKPLVCKLEVGG